MLLDKGGVQIYFIMFALNLTLPLLMDSSSPRMYFEGSQVAGKVGPKLFLLFKFFLMRMKKETIHSCMEIAKISLLTFCILMGSATSLLILRQFEGSQVTLIFFLRSF